MSWPSRTAKAPLTMTWQIPSGSRRIGIIGPGADLCVVERVEIGEFAGREHASILELESPRRLRARLDDRVCKRRPAHVHSPCAMSRNCWWSAAWRPTTQRSGAGFSDTARNWIGGCADYRQNNVTHPLHRHAERHRQARPALSGTQTGFGSVGLLLQGNRPEREPS